VALRLRLLLFILFVSVVILVTVKVIQNQSPAHDVTMSRYNTSRTGTNLQEPILNTSNVTPLNFGKVFSRPVVGDIYAQPLYVSSLDLPGQGKHNVVYVATMHNNVYAFDADDPAQNTPLWQVNFGPSWTTTNESDIWNAEIGILSTPTIDLTTKTMYLINLRQGQDSAAPVFWIHALDLATGQEKFNGPTAIQASVNGIGSGNVNGKITLDGTQQFQRMGLALVNGRIYAGFSSGIGTASPYHGWLISYDATDLTRPPIVWNTTPDGDQGGIWQAGVAPVIDSAGDLYFGVGNGSFNADTGGRNYADSFLHIHPTADGITVADYFTPYDTDFINADDMDVATSGTVMLPGTHLLFAGEKHGQAYLIDSTAMGRHNSVDNHQINQSFGAYRGWLMAPPVVWNRGQDTTIYLWSLDDHLRVYQMANGQVQTDPIQTSDFANDGVRSPELTLSADGSKPGTAILWAVQSASGKSGVLRALDANDVTHELWNSNMNGTQDQVGALAKFNAPIVANGKVYLGTFSNQLVVYGLLPAPRSLQDSTPALVGTGTGLQGQYFDDISLTKLDVSRVDSTVDFNWGTNSPAPNVPSDHFSVRWQGQVQGLETGYYTFYVTADDGARLWVDNIPMFDHWASEANATFSGTILLRAGQKYDLTLEYYEDSGGASVNLQWSGPGFAKTIIPATQLYPATQKIAATDSVPTVDVTAIDAAIAHADPSHGANLFTQYGCAACHTSGVGPSLQGLGQRADARRPGYSAAAYIFESITDPNAYVVPGYTANIMPTNYKALIPTSDLNDLIAWLTQQ
jgi:cytochrome c2